MNRGWQNDDVAMVQLGFWGFRELLVDYADTDGTFLGLGHLGYYSSYSQSKLVRKMLWRFFNVN